jgi:hypothetical protein
VGEWAPGHAGRACRRGHSDSEGLGDELLAWLREQGDWVQLGSADEQKPAKDGTVEAWARSEGNPRGGWYGLRKGYRGRVGMSVPPLLEELGLVELDHNARNNRMRAR